MRYPDANPPAGWTVRLCRPDGSTEAVLIVSGLDLRTMHGQAQVGEMVARAFNDRGQLSLLTTTEGAP